MCKEPNEFHIMKQKIYEKSTMDPQTYRNVQTILVRVVEWKTYRRKNFLKLEIIHVHSDPTVSEIYTYPEVSECSAIVFDNAFNPSNGKDNVRL